MKHIFVALTLSLSVMVVTRSRPSIEPHFKTYGDVCAGSCYRREFDSSCRIFFGCGASYTNCHLLPLPWTHWIGPVDYSECKLATRKDQVVVCNSACSITYCDDTIDLVCGAHSLSTKCFVFRSTCWMHKYSCKNPDWYNAGIAKCRKAGLTKPGDYGDC